MQKSFLPFCRLFFPLTLLIILIVGTLSASNPYAENQYIYAVGYHGNTLWNPGINAGVEIPRSFETTTNRKEQTIRKFKFWQADAGFFADRRTELGLYAHGGLTWRRQKSDKPYWQLGVSPVGFYRSFLPNTYEFTDEGLVTDTVESLTLAGNFYFAPAFSLQTGKISSSNPLSNWFAEINIITLMPYNTYIMPLVNVKVGYRLFQLNHSN
ncbi:MAG: hypothetical protein ACOC31_01025 [Bacteroidota bacterium]